MTNVFDINMGRTNKDQSKISWKYIMTELVLIVVGILLAINLNSWYSNYKVERQIEQSLTQINEEIALNIVELREVTEANADLNNFYGQLSALNGDEMDVPVCSESTMSDLKNTYGNLFEVKDSSRIANDLYQYELNLSFSLEYGELNSLAWQTAQLSTNISEYGYNCLKNILSVYSFQELFEEVQSKFLDYKTLQDKEEFIVTFLLCHKMAIDLLDRYEILQQEIKDCR